MCTNSVIKLTNIIINNHDNSVYLVNLCTVSKDNPVIRFIFLLIPWLYAGEFFPTVM